MREESHKSNGGCHPAVALLLVVVIPCPMSIYSLEKAILGENRKKRCLAVENSQQKYSQLDTEEMLSTGGPFKCTAPGLSTLPFCFMKLLMFADTGNSLS